MPERVAVNHVIHVESFAEGMSRNEAFMIVLKGALLKPWSSPADRLIALAAGISGGSSAGGFNRV